MLTPQSDIIDWSAFAAARATLGANFVRIVGYFREDGEKSLVAIEQAMRRDDSRGLVLPAHTLKGESNQFGAVKLGLLSEQVEMRARRLIEIQEGPSELLALVVEMRPLFNATLAAIDGELSPLVERRVGGFGRKVQATSSDFGRI